MRPRQAGGSTAQLLPQEQKIERIIYSFRALTLAAPDRLFAIELIGLSFCSNQILLSLLILAKPFPKLG